MAAQLGARGDGGEANGIGSQNEPLLLTVLRRRGSLAARDTERLSTLSAKKFLVSMRRFQSDGLLLRGRPLPSKVDRPALSLLFTLGGAWFLGLWLAVRLRW